MKGLTQKDLNQMGCDNPACTEPAEHDFVILPACHPKSGAVALYVKSRGTLMFKCREPQCDNFVCEIAVAEGPKLKLVPPSVPTNYAN